MEDKLCWKKTYGGRQPSEEEDLHWKMTFGGSRPSGDLACCLIGFAAFLSHCFHSEVSNKTARLWQTYFCRYFTPHLSYHRPFVWYPGYHGHTFLQPCIQESSFGLSRICTCLRIDVLQPTLFNQS